jgi:rSAM/selenodomain-associated transferase 2
MIIGLRALAPSRFIMPPTVSVVIPVLFDADAASTVLASLAGEPGIEVLVVDGAADPRLAEVVAAHGGATLVKSGAGRGRQMNAGASVATGEWVLFLHADSVLPSGWLAAIGSLGGPVVGGWFRFALDDAAWQARVIERLTRWRVRRLHLPYGDQGIFVRRSVFTQLGGFRDIPLMEDVEFVRRLVRSGSVVELPLPLATSARRWRRDGWLRRSTHNLVLVGLYFAGINIERLARWYRSADRG